MRLSRSIIAAVVYLFGFFDLLAAQDQRSALLNTDQRASQLASDSGLAVAMRQVLDRNGVLLWPEAPVLSGRTELNDFVGSRAAVPFPRLIWQPLEVQLSRDSTLAALWGVTALVSPTPAANPALGRFISVWRRDHTGWAVSALVFIGIKMPASSTLPPGIRLSRRADQFTGEVQPFVAADLAFARLAQDSGAATAFRTWAADDAIIFGSGGLLARGPAAVARAVAGPEQWNWHPVSAGAAASGDLGWTVGEAVITGKDGEPSYSKYLTVWTRRGGALRFLLDGGNGRPPAP
jgi:hypothetical protein